MKKTSMPDLEEFKAMLRSRDLKATPQRLAVHEAMMALVHASAEQVTGYLRVTSRTEITLTSVYNVLNQMTEAGIYAKRTSQDNRMYFDINAFNHVHLYDEVNHVFMDFDDRGLLELVAKAMGGRKMKGYNIERADIQLICRPTRKKKRSIPV